MRENYYLIGQSSLNASESHKYDICKTGFNHITENYLNITIIPLPSHTKQLIREPMNEINANIL